MKILVNGSSISEMLNEKVVKVREFKRSELVECNFENTAITIEDITMFDKFIGHLKRNKTMYLKLAMMLAVSIDSGTLTVLAAGSLESGIGAMAKSLVGKLIILAKYACMGMGLKEMVICLLNGGNMREASFAGLQYWLGYLFLQFYPTLYEYNF